MTKVKVGLLRETKNPPDKRVPLSPADCVELVKRFPEVELFIQSSKIRCFTDNEYADAGLMVKDDISDCDIVLGVKEVKIATLMQDKKYLFFAHVAKKQPHNRELLQEILKKNITLIDYEYLTEQNGARVVAFGHWAGVVGAYNGLRAYGERFGDYSLKPAHSYFDMKAMYHDLKGTKLPNIKILITGGGRVAHGAMQTLDVLNIKEVSPNDFLTKTYDEPVLCQINPDSYVKRKDGEAFELSHFFNHPTEYSSTFLPFTKVTDMYIPCHFWHPDSPPFMTPGDMKADDFKIKVIADVSCDLKIPIPSTIRASKIADPFYDYNPETEKEETAFSNENNITVMAVDNLPGELPRDASEYFGKELLNNVFPSLIKDDVQGIVERATITESGKLTEKFSYLQEYADETIEA